MANTLDRHMWLDCRCTEVTAIQSVGPEVYRRLGIGFNRIQFWRQKQSQRLALLDLDDHQLSDIGISREAARREAEKPFWR